jgi:hypothetical protein
MKNFTEIHQKKQNKFQKCIARFWELCNERWREVVAHFE